MSHTPGPWRAERGGGHAHNGIYGAESIQTNGWPEPRGRVRNASYSGRVCENMGGLDLPGPAASARLIAAAPELLIALENIINGGNADHGTYWQVDADDIAAARAAIARATGAEQSEAKPTGAAHG